MREAVIDRALEGEAVGRFAALEVENLSYAVNSRRLLDGVTVTMPGRGVSVVMGPNGAGKSLFLRLIHGLLEPTNGRVRWNGLNLSPEMTKRQSLVFQKPVLLRRSVAANIDFILKSRGKKENGARDALLRRVGLFHLAQSPARKLSGGEAQRLQLARAIATDPEVLLLDEPTASLDPSSTAAIEAMVREVSKQGVKVIYITHDIGQAERLADDIVFFAGGRAVEQADAAEFFTSPSTPQARAYLGGHLVY